MFRLSASPSDINKLASGDYDGPGFANQHVTSIDVIVDNVAKQRLAVGSLT